MNTPHVSQLNEKQFTFFTFMLYSKAFVLHFRVSAHSVSYLNGNFSWPSLQNNANCREEWSQSNQYCQNMSFLSMALDQEFNFTQTNVFRSCQLHNVISYIKKKNTNLLKSQWKTHFNFLQFKIFTFAMISHCLLVLVKMISVTEMMCQL